MSVSADPVAEAALRLEAAVARLGRAASMRPVVLPAEDAPAGGVDTAAVADLAARLDATIARLRGVLGEEP